MTGRRGTRRERIVALVVLGQFAILAGCDQPAQGRQDAALAEQMRERGGVEDPAAYVRSLYAMEALEAEVELVPHAQHPDFTPRLRTLFADDALHAGDEVGRLAFNFVTGAQDDDITSIDVRESDVSNAADRKVVIADFVSIRVPARVTYYFERSEGRWYLDDVSSPGNIAADMPAWTLSLVLKYGWTDMALTQGNGHDVAQDSD